VRHLCTACGIETHDLPPRVQLVSRWASDGRRFDYYLNHNSHEVTFRAVPGGRNLLVGQGRFNSLTLGPWGAAVLDVEQR